MTAEHHHSYFKEFKYFSSIYKDRENHLSNAILDCLKGSFKSNNKTYRILDVGSSDGALLQALIKRLPSDTKNKIEAIALEPDEEAIDHLREKLKYKSSISSEWSVESYLTSIEDYLIKSEVEQKFDLILCSHVFYHIDPSRWKSVISALKDLLKPQGEIIVILDSYDSPVYKFKNEITPFFKENSIIQPFGSEISAEMFKDFLIQQKVVYQYQVLDSNLLIQKNNGINNLAEVLSFLYRHEINSTIELREKLNKWSNNYIHPQNNHCYKVPWKEYVFNVS